MNSFLQSRHCSGRSWKSILSSDSRNERQTRPQLTLPRRRDAVKRARMRAHDQSVRRCRFCPAGGWLPRGADHRHQVRAQRSRQVGGRGAGRRHGRRRRRRRTWRWWRRRRRPGRRARRRECKAAADCVVEPLDCCDCANGGKQHAIAKKTAAAAKSAHAAKCKAQMCTMMLSTDPSCGMQRRLRRRRVRDGEEGEVR